jgi:hypothetical protein
MDEPDLHWVEDGPVCCECGALIDAARPYVVERVNEYRTRLFCNEVCRTEFYGEVREGRSVF